MAHYLGAGPFPYTLGDDLASAAKAAAEHYRFIDRNMHATSDLVGIVAHWGTPRQNGYTHRWTGDAWGTGTIERDPTPDLVFPNRPWSNVRRLTDATGKLRVCTTAEHLAAGVAAGVVVMLEAKGSVTLDDPAFWTGLGLEADAVGHPRTMMTLTDIGSPVKRLRGAHAAGFQTAILPRGNEPTPADWASRWAPVVDVIWGTAWPNRIP